MEQSVGGIPFEHILELLNLVGFYEMPSSSGQKLLGLAYLWTVGYASGCNLASYKRPVLKVDSSFNMDIITGSQHAGPVYVPVVNLKDAADIFSKLYNREVDQIKTLPGYDSKNYYIQTFPTETGIVREEYVLKIFFSSQKKEILDITVASMLYVKSCGIVCSTPVKTQDGKYTTMREFRCLPLSSDSDGKNGEITDLFVVYALTYVPGQILGSVCPDRIPQDWYQVLGQYLARLDTILLKYPNRDHVPVMTKHGRNYEWSLNTLPRYRALLHVVDDEDLKSIIESVISNFEREVVPKIGQLRKGMIYGDFNDNNIIVNIPNSSPVMQSNHIRSTGIIRRKQAELKVVGLIDFCDVRYACLLFEVAIALAYMMYIQKQDLLAVGCDFLRSYHSVLPLTSEEWHLLPLCVAGRCVQSILNGLYTHQQDPTNEYVLIDIKKAEKVIKFISSLPREQVVNKWMGGQHVEGDM